MVYTYHIIQNILLTAEASFAVHVMMEKIRNIRAYSPMRDQSRWYFSCFVKNITGIVLASSLWLLDMLLYYSEELTILSSIDNIAEISTPITPT